MGGNPRHVTTQVVRDDPDPVAEAHERPRLFIYPDMAATVGEVGNWSKHHDPEFSLNQGFLSFIAKIALKMRSGNTVFLPLVGMSKEEVSDFLQTIIIETAMKVKIGLPHAWNASPVNLLHTSGNSLREIMY
jgi:hypothetical protein